MELPTRRGTLLALEQSPERRGMASSVQASVGSSLCAPSITVDTPGDSPRNLLVVVGAGYAFQRYHGSMDVYEEWILIGSVPALVALGWFWGTLRALSLGVGAATLVAIALYNRNLDGFGADLAQADNVFLLKYFISSQSAILWMAVLFCMSTVLYWIGMLAKAGVGWLQRRKLYAKWQKPARFDRNLVVIGAGAAGLAGLLAACGGDDSGAGSTAGTTAGSGSAGTRIHISR